MDKTLLISTARAASELWRPRGAALASIGLGKEGIRACARQKARRNCRSGRVTFSCLSDALPQLLNMLFCAGWKVAW